MGLIKTPKFNIEYSDINNFPDEINDTKIDDFPKLSDKYEFLVSGTVAKTRLEYDDEYKKMSYEYYHSSIHVLRYVLKHRDYNDVIDYCSLPMLYYMRHAIELLLKAAIFKENKNKKKTQSLIQKHVHNISELFRLLTSKPDNHEWLDKYLLNMTKEDPSENLFRYAMKDSFRSHYYFIDSIYTMLVSIFAFDSISKHYFDDYVISNSEYSEFQKEVFSNSPEGEYLIPANHGLGNMYTWQSSELDIYKQISGFRDVGKILFICKSDKHSILWLPMIYALRHSLELSLKNIITTLHSYIKRHLKKPQLKDIPDEAYKTHEFKEIWKYGKRIIEFFAKENKWDLTKIDEIEKAILYIHDIDSKSDYFRYPTDKNLNFYNHNNIDYEKAYNTFMELIELMDNMGYVIEDMNESVNEMLQMEYNEDY